VLNLVTNPLAAIVTLYSLAEERLKREQKGATAVEYGLMVGLIAVGIITAVLLLRTQLSALFTSIAGSLGTAAAGGGGAPAAG
jgi:pilus assembly protein Flp/PilA